MRKISMLAAACVLAGGAWAQQDNPANPHSTQNPDRPTAKVPASDTDRQTREAESSNPHATNNPSDDSKPEGKANVDAVERNNPHSTHAKDHKGMEMGPVTADAVMQRLHAANLNEIAMGQLAQQNGSPRVQQYGKTLVTDHQNNDKQLRDLAGKKSVSLSSAPSDKMAKEEMKDGHEMHEKLAKLNGADFDKAFARAMADDHRRDVAHVQAWRTSIKDAEVSALLDQTLPVLQQHQRTAESLRQPAAQGRTP